MKLIALICLMISCPLEASQDSIKEESKDTALDNSVYKEILNEIIFELRFAIEIEQGIMQRMAVSADFMRGLLVSLDISKLPEKIQKEYVSLMLDIIKSLSMAQSAPHPQDGMARAGYYYECIASFAYKHGVYNEEMDTSISEGLENLASDLHDDVLIEKEAYEQFLIRAAILKSELKKKYVK